ncbi:MAG: hypothetical protein L3J13_04940 [Devosiaceae bacterium]|nr:hypothetical protein [Devosiaceae bacterium]
MILLCVGNADPFNRLVRTMDTWAKENPKTRITAQIGTATFHPSNFDHIDFFPTTVALKEAYDNADLLVSDLSVEVILPATQRGLPVLALPRLSIFGEEIGIAQSTLAAELKSDEFIRVAKNEQQLFDLLSMPRMPTRAPPKKGRTADNLAGIQARLINSLGKAG